MTKPEWGLKRKCLKCGAFFYDMKKSEFSCPKCGKQYSLLSYEEDKVKQLQKLARKAAPKIDDEDLDEEALLHMTEDVPFGDDEINSDDIDLLEDGDEMESSSTDLGGIVDDYNDDKNEQ